LVEATARCCITYVESGVIDHEFPLAWAKVSPKHWPTGQPVEGSSALAAGARACPARDTHHSELRDRARSGTSSFDIAPRRTRRSSETTSCAPSHRARAE